MDRSRMIPSTPGGRFRFLHFFLPLLVGALMLLAPPGVATSFPKKRAQQPEEVRTLAAGVPIERELSGGKAHSYQITLNAGQYLHIEVEQKGINVALELLSPDSSTVVRTDLTLAVGRESLSYESTSDGQYRLIVLAVSPSAPAGMYQALLEVKPKASPRDKQRILAEQSLNEAYTLARQPSDKQQPAMEKYQQVAALWREVGDRNWEAYALMELARIHALQNRFEKGIEFFTEALAINREIRYRPGEGAALNNLGICNFNLGRHEKAVEYYEQALVINHEVKDRDGELGMLSNLGGLLIRMGHTKRGIEHFDQALTIAREVKNRATEGNILYNLGITHSNQGQHEKAIEYYEQALVIEHELKNRAMEGNALFNLGKAHFYLSQYEKAVEYLEQALVIKREAKNRNDEGVVLKTIGAVYIWRSQYEKAIEYFEKALAISREVKYRLLEGSTLNDLGNSYRQLSQYEKAIVYLEQALAIAREVKERGLEGDVLTNLGLSYRSLSQIEKAIEHHAQALVLYREEKDRNKEGLALNNLGEDYRSQSQYEKAIEFFDQALAIKREFKDRSGEGMILNNLGTASRLLNRYEKAVEFYERALAIYREIKDRGGESSALNQLGNVYYRLDQSEKAIGYYEQALAIRREVKNREAEVNTLSAFARAEWKRGNLSRARTLIEGSLRLAESLRSDLFNRDLRASYFSSVQEEYQFYIDLLMQLHEAHPAEGFDALAMRASERARARVLLEMLAEARVDIQQGVEKNLLERESRLTQQINALAARQTQLLSGKHTSEKVESVRKEFGALEAELQQAQAAIRRSSPRYAALTQPQPSSAPEIQQMLDSDTILMEYALGKERSYLWVVTPDSIRSHRLPPQSEIEAAATRVCELLVSRRDETDVDYRTVAEGLSRVLLGPVGAQLGGKRLLIVASGPLQYLPFAALPIPASHQPLIVEHEIVILPSASVLAVLRRESSGRQSAAKAVAVLADPVFGRDDPRFGSGGNTRTGHSRSRAEMRETAPLPALSPELERAVRDVGAGNDQRPLSRLPFSRREAEAILALTPRDMVMTALDFEASRARVMGGELDQYRIVHFATHGLLDGEHPELSGLVFSLVDQNGKPQDGYLRLHDIFNLRLSADVVVLSACRTGLGKDIKGEGLVGLTRGFMYAGAPRVVASLWQVDDVATAELMKRFYRGMLRDGLRPAAALRAAQIEMLNKKPWRAPFYWGAFTLQGEWR